MKLGNSQDTVAGIYFSVFCSDKMPQTPAVVSGALQAGSCIDNGWLVTTWAKECLDHLLYYNVGTECNETQPINGHILQWNLT